MADEGWIKLYRSIRSNWLWDDGNERYLKWGLDILLDVNHSPKKTLINGKFVEVKTGQKKTSVLKLSERWGVSRNTVRKFLDLLEEDDMISRKSRTTDGTTLEVRNYADYQSFNSEKGQQNGQQTDQRTDHKQELNKEPVVDFKKFMEFFNQKTGKHYRDVEANRKLIRARLNDGYSKKDLAFVVELKSKQWRDDSKMRKYLRPSTLFAPTNFENYVNEDAISQPAKATTPDVKVTKDDSIREALEMNGGDAEAVINNFETDPDIPITREDVEEYVQRH